MSLTTTTTDLTGFFDGLVADMHSRAADTMARVVETGARQAAAEPWRIGKIVYGEAQWPAVDISGDLIPAIDVLADCRTKLAAERERHRTGHWCRDHNRLTALRQAEAALALLVVE